MTNAAPFAELCPGCFNGKGNTSICPRCGYDEGLKRGPLFLPHRTLLHHGQYLIGKVLGKPGGFGITYLALDTKLETKVAIKEYLPRDLAGRDAGHATISAHSEEDGEFFRYGLTQFLQEARTLAQFDHANIVRVRNFFEENGTGYLVMDYYDGITLADYLAQQPQGRLPEKTAVGILMPILDGLREVHAKSFLHRDIKPQNIYLTTANRPILLDFGAARQAMGERSRSLSVVLSEGYAPYEQYHRRGEQGPWTDIYACAAVLYHAVAGEAPPPATERVHKDELDIDGIGVSALLAEALLLGLSVDHHIRPQRMTEFQALLLLGRDPTGTNAVDIEPKNTDLPVLTKKAPPRANESKKNKSPSVWWVPALAVVIVIAITAINAHKQSGPTPSVQVPVAIEAKLEPDKVVVPDPSAPMASDATLKKLDDRDMTDRAREEAEKKQATEKMDAELARAEQQAWQQANTANTLAAYVGYLEKYPNGRYTALAKEAKTLRETGEREQRVAAEILRREQEAKESAAERASQEAKRKSDAEQEVRDAAATHAKQEAQNKADAEMRAGRVFKDCVDCPEMVVIPAGSFEMGDKSIGSNDERPVHTVRIARPFAMGKTEVTQHQWRAIMGTDPPDLEFKGCDDCPVDNVSWNDAKMYVFELSRKTGKTYRLPSEAEWEYACRAGQSQTYCGSQSVGSVAWYGLNSGTLGNRKTSPVARKLANAWGLYDMSGNVEEWTEDCWNRNYDNAPTDGSAWSSGECGLRVLRGGDWKKDDWKNRAAYRNRAAPRLRWDDMGFRLARTFP